MFCLLKPGLQLPHRLLQSLLHLFQVCARVLLLLQLLCHHGCLCGRRWRGRGSKSLRALLGAPTVPAQPHVGDGLLGLFLGFPPFLGSLLRLPAQLGQIHL